MPSRKQRRREAKERRHQYETVWVDADGNELEEPPEDVPARPARDKKPQQQGKRTEKRPSRAQARTPLPPSWRRAGRRALLLGVVIFVLFAVVNTKNGSSGYLSALFLAVLYTVLFVPFTYYVDRFAYRRWQRKDAEQPKKR